MGELAVGRFQTERRKRLVSTHQLGQLLQLLGNARICGMECLGLPQQLDCLLGGGQAIGMDDGCLPQQGHPRHGMSFGPGASEQYLGEGTIVLGSAVELDQPIAHPASMGALQDPRHGGQLAL